MLCLECAWQCNSVSQSVRHHRHQHVQEIPEHVRTAIAKDVPRSFPEYAFFDDPANRTVLERMLVAYAALDPGLGYCQGCVSSTAFSLVTRLITSLARVRFIILPQF